MLFAPGSPEDRIYRDYALWLGHTSEVARPRKLLLPELGEMYDGFFLDSYGVLNRAREVLPHAAEGVAWLKKQGKTVRVLTNNAALSEHENARLLRHLGIPLDADDVICSGSLLDGLTAAGEVEGPALFLGLPGGAGYLENAGLKMTDDPREARSVVLASSRGYRASRLALALRALERGDVPLVVLNPDTVAPREGGRMFRVSGVTARSLSKRTGCRVHLLGKPFPEMYAMALRRTGLEANRCVALGDTLATDILGARHAGFGAALVLTGVTPPEKAQEEARAARIWPDFLLPDLSVA